MKMEAVYKFYLVLVFFGILMNQQQVFAAQHSVGGSQGWGESTDFSSWASGQTFKVGDQLVFKYMSGLHSVVELANESAYKNCDISSSLDSMNGGNDVVKLNKSGTRYFACGTMGHCDQGMKVKITTVSADSSSTPSGSSSSNTTPTSTSGAASFGSLVPILMVAFPIFHVFFIVFV